TAPCGTVAGVVVSFTVAFKVAFCPWMGGGSATATLVVVASSAANAGATGRTHGRSTAATKSVADLMGPPSSTARDATSAVAAAHRAYARSRRPRAPYLSRGYGPGPR